MAAPGPRAACVDRSPQANGLPVRAAPGRDGSMVEVIRRAVSGWTARQQPRRDPAGEGGQPPSPDLDRTSRGRLDRHGDEAAFAATRPLTHDLCKSLIVGLGGTLRRVQITKVQKSTYYAELHVVRADGVVHIDARPSDSIAIALRMAAPIFAPEALLTAVADEDGADELAGGRTRMRWHPKNSRPISSRRISRTCVLKTSASSTCSARGSGARGEWRQSRRACSGDGRHVALGAACLLPGAASSAPWRRLGGGAALTPVVRPPNAAAPAPRAVPVHRRRRGGSFGRVMHAGSTRRRRRSAGTLVTLHRVGSDTAGPMDSLRTDANGQYAFRYQPRGVERTPCISCRRATTASRISRSRLASRVTRGPDAEITVFDTTSQPVPIRDPRPPSGRVRTEGRVERDRRRSLRAVQRFVGHAGVAGRHRAIAPRGTPRSHHRRKGCRSDRATCRPTPSRSCIGDFEVFAPFAPGLKQFSFTYELPSSAFPLVRPRRRQCRCWRCCWRSRRPVWRRRDCARSIRSRSRGAPFAGSSRRMCRPARSRGSRSRSSPAIARTVYFALVLVAIGAAMLAALARAFTRRPATKCCRLLVRNPEGVRFAPTNGGAASCATPRNRTTADG